MQKVINKDLLCHFFVIVYAYIILEAFSHLRISDWYFTKRYNIQIDLVDRYIKLTPIIKAIYNPVWKLIEHLHQHFLSGHPLPHYYRIHHRKRPITAGLFRTGGDSISPSVPNGPGGDANISPPVCNTTGRWCSREHHRRVVLRTGGDMLASPPGSFETGGDRLSPPVRNKPAVMGRLRWDNL